MVNLKLPALRERPSDIVPLAQFFADKYAEQNGVDKKKLSKEAQEHVKSNGWRGNIRELENTMHRAILMSVQDEIEASAIMIQSSFGDDNATSAAPSNAATTNAPADSGSDAAAQDDAGQALQNKSGVESLIGKTMAEVERDMIVNTLEHCVGNRTHAANILGISIRTLRNKLNQYKEEGVDIPNAGSGN